MYKWKGNKNEQPVYLGVALSQRGLWEGQLNFDELQRQRPRKLLNEKLIQLWFVAQFIISFDVFISGNWPETKVLIQLYMFQSYTCQCRC